ncbi:MAG TPA: ZIP family magnesium transporter, partial [Acidobacteriota bacterium]|nr:ZIP family magnesium transporter [Acidobacteriota bacterium]
MSQQFFTTLILGAIAAAANVLGGYAVSYQKMLDRFLLRFLIAMGAGFLLAATFLVVIPESAARNARTPWILLSGYLFMQFFQHTV